MKGKLVIVAAVVTMIAQSMLADTSVKTGAKFPENGPARTPGQWVLRVVFGC